MSNHILIDAEPPLDPNNNNNINEHYLSATTYDFLKAADKINHQ